MFYRKNEFSRQEYKLFLQETLPLVSLAVFDELKEVRERRLGITSLVLAEAATAMRSKTFNRHRPHDHEAWQIISWPIRVAADFEFKRLHLLALMRQKLAAHVDDEVILREEEHIGRILTF